MMRFGLGVVVGAVLGRPIMAILNRRILPVAVEKTLVVLSKTANRAADYVDRYSEKEKQR